jgi:hypothetical protein
MIELAINLRDYTVESSQEFGFGRGATRLPSSMFKDLYNVIIILFNFLV